MKNSKKLTVDDLCAELESLVKIRKICFFILYIVILIAMLFVLYLMNAWFALVFFMIAIIFRYAITANVIERQILYLLIVYRHLLDDIYQDYIDFPPEKFDSLSLLAQDLFTRLQNRYNETRSQYQEP